MAVTRRWRNCIVTWRRDDCKQKWKRYLNKSKLVHIDMINFRMLICKLLSAELHVCQRSHCFLDVAGWFMLFMLKFASCGLPMALKYHPGKFFFNSGEYIL